MVKEFLSQHGVPYEERDVSVNQGYAREMIQKTGQMGVPVTVVNDQAVIGFDRGRLEQLVPLMQAGRRLVFGAAIADAGPITGRQGLEPAQGAYIGRITPGSVAEKTFPTSEPPIPHTPSVGGAGILSGSFCERHVVTE